MKEPTTQDPNTPPLHHSNTPLADADLTEFQTILTDIKGCSAEFKNLPATIRSIQDENATLRQDLTAVRRSALSRHSTLGSGLRRLRPPSRRHFHPSLRPQW